MGLGCHVGSVLQDPLKEVGFESRAARSSERGRIRVEGE